MPYILQSSRDKFTDSCKFIGENCENAGELNYCITEILLSYLGEKYCYQAINNVVGALECCKLELYRRLAAPYEDKKCDDNGDLFEEIRK